MEKRTFVLKGDICYSRNSGTLSMTAGGYAVCVQGICQGVFEELPEQYGDLPVHDCRGALIIPGLTDLHIHAPQFAFRGTGMDLELLEWLNQFAFPEEARYGDPEYAGRAYKIFADTLKRSATTRACIFATIHRPTVELLMELMEETGLETMVGKVNMDRNSPNFLVEAGAAESAEETVRWLEETRGRYHYVKPILTPRFIPSCTDELMRRLKEIQNRYHLPLQSHLSENPSEIAWVQELCPDSRFYGDAYDRFGLFGGDEKAVMAHCVYSGEEECRRMKERGVYVAHCPESNMNLASGIAPVRSFLDMGVKTGLGSDVAGGSSESIFRAMRQAIQVSKLRWRLSDESLKPLTVEEAFYMGTKGGGEFFGKVGSFEPGYEFDAVVLCDDSLAHPQPVTMKQRLERMIYLGDDRHVAEKYVSGRKIL